MAARDFFLGRREFMKKMGFVAGAAAAVPAGLSLMNRSRTEVSGQGVKAAEALAADAPAPTAGPAGVAAAQTVASGPTREQVRRLFGKLGEGSRIGRWTIVKIHDVRMGAIPVVLRGKNGDEFQVDVLRREKGLIATLGVANTPSLSFFLANGGNGYLRTREEHGLGAMALAMVLERREAKGAPVPALLTLRQRNSSFPNGDYGVVAGGQHTPVAIFA